ncbi:MAG: hypothetical protein KF789_02940 [Bdellovibrionaceae bacterium]|nr:hypothetical protein [Pseudobdellovibrionaceae bacterium]
MSDESLLQEIAALENLEMAFYQCLQGKRSQLSPQVAFLRMDAYLERLRNLVLDGEKYPWGEYREFYVSDPKRRLVASAPFVDRVVHRAIYNVINPLLDGRLCENSFACRQGKGNARAVIKLYEILRTTPDRYVVKLDVRKCFASVHHGRLLGKLFSYLPDDSCAGLFKGLLKSHPDCRIGVGLPLGNLTSQIFTNFYLHDLDDFLMEQLGGRYLRYMDDMILICSNLEHARMLVDEVIRRAKIEKLKFPSRKRLWLGKEPVPFLGFLVGADFIRPLNRNRRRVHRKINEKVKRGALPSEVAQSILSYEAWMSYPLRKMNM